MTLTGIAVGPHGKVYLADGANHRLYRLSPETGEVSMVAGSRRGCVDGPRAEARFRSPGHLAFDQSGGLWVGEGTPWPRRLGPTGEVETVGLDACPEPTDGLACLPTGELVVASAEGRCLLIARDGRFEPFATIPRQPQPGPSYGREPAAIAPIGWPLAASASGDLYLAATDDNQIWRIARDGRATVLAGRPGAGFADRRGERARFRGPAGIAAAPDGTVFVADAWNHRIRVVQRDGQVHTLVGAEPGDQDGNRQVARFRAPGPMALDPRGDLWVVDAGQRVCRVTPAGEVYTVIRFPEVVDAAAAGCKRPLEGPRRLARGHDGALYVLETHHNRVQRIGADGTLEPVYWEEAGPFAADSRLHDLAADDLGRLVAIDGRKGAVVVLADGNRSTGLAHVPPEPWQDTEMRIAKLPGGAFVVATGSRLYRVRHDGEVTHLAGGLRGAADGRGPEARFDKIVDLAVSRFGDILVAEASRIVRVTPDGTATTLLGRDEAFTDAEGRWYPLPTIQGICFTPTDVLLVADRHNEQIFEIAPTPTTTWRQVQPLAKPVRRRPGDRPALESAAARAMTAKPYLDTFDALLGQTLTGVELICGWRAARLETDDAWFQVVSDRDYGLGVGWWPEDRADASSEPSMANGRRIVEVSLHVNVEGRCRLVRLGFQDGSRLSVGAPLDPLGPTTTDPAGPARRWLDALGHQLEALEADRLMLHPPARAVSLPETCGPLALNAVSWREESLEPMVADGQVITGVEVRYVLTDNLVAEYVGFWTDDGHQFMLSPPGIRAPMVYLRGQARFSSPGRPSTTKGRLRSAAWPATRHGWQRCHARCCGWRAT